MRTTGKAGKTYTWTGVALVVLALAVSASAQEYEGRTVSAVEIDGLERIGGQVVRAKLEAQAGQEFNARTIARDIRRLYSTGFFTRIEADAALDDGEVILTYRVREKQVVAEVRIIGNRRVKTRKIRGVLTMREGSSFVPEAYNEEREAILGLYEKKGFANATVDMLVLKAGPSRVQLIYDIHEGRKARIREIRFVGRSAISRYRMRRIMKTRSGWWFMGGKFQEEKLEEDLDKFLEEYGNRGYLEADIPRTEIEYTKRGKGMILTIHIREGAQYRVDTLEVAGNSVLDDDEVLQIVEVEAGDIHNKGQVSEDAELMQRYYESSGYVYARVAPQVTLDRERKRTYLVQKVTENDLRYLQEIKITGNEVTRDDVIRREMLLRPGDRYDGDLVHAAELRLKNTEYFDEVRINIEDFEDTDLYSALYTNLMLNVEEGKTGNFRFGAGYSTEEAFGGFAELRFNNFDITNWPRFSGGGQQLSLKLDLGQVRNQYSLSFTEPEFLGYPLAAGFDLYRQSYEITGGAEYHEDTDGLQLRFGKALSPYVTARVSVAFDRTDLSDLPMRMNEAIRQQAGESFVLSTRWQIERNTLDNRRDPSQGSKHLLSTRIAGFGGDYQFWQVEHESAWHRGFGEEKRWVLSFRVREGFVTAYGASRFVPLQDRYYAGGTTTVRGYDIRDIGPKGHEYGWYGSEFALGGNLRVLGNLELKYRLTKALRLYAFVDSGGVWEHFTDINLPDMRYSYGFGFGVDVPRMGPIRIDYGIPINPGKDQGNGRLHLIAGFGF